MTERDLPANNPTHEQTSQEQAKAIQPLDELSLIEGQSAQLSRAISPQTADQLREQAVNKLAATPLFDPKRAALLPPTAQIIGADMSAMEKIKIISAIDDQVRRIKNAAPGDADRLITNGYTHVLDLQTEAIKRLQENWEVIEGARLRPTAAMYASARSGPFRENTLVVEAVGLIVDHLINKVRPGYAPADAPGVSISNGGGNTGGMQVMNDAALLALGDADQKSFPAKALLIPLLIRTDREEPYTLTHPALEMTHGHDALHPRTACINVAGNEHPLQRSSSCVVFACGAGGWEEAAREIAEISAGREQGILSSIPHGKRHVHFVGEREFFAPAERFFNDQVNIGAFSKPTLERIHFWDLKETADGQRAAEAIGATFEEQRPKNKPRPIYLGEEKDRELAQQFAVEVWKGRESPMASPTFNSAGRIHPMDISADNLYRKEAQLAATQEVLKAFHQDGVSAEEAIGAGMAYMHENADALHLLTKEVGNRPTVVFMGHSRGRGAPLLTPELKNVGANLVSACVEQGVSVLLASHGRAGVNAFLTDRFIDAQRKNQNSKSLLILGQPDKPLASKIAKDESLSGHVQQIPEALQSLLGRSLVKYTIGTPLVNVFLGPVSADDLGMLAQSVTDVQLRGITRSPVDRLPLPTDNFVFSGHYMEAKEGNYQGLHEQYLTLIERGTMDDKDLSSHHFMKTRDLPTTKKNLTYFRNHLSDYLDLLK